jgi:cyclase
VYAEAFLFLCKAGAVLFMGMLAGALPANAAPVLKHIGPGLYAYISDNEGSANSTFLIGNDGILVVDTGVDPKEANKLLDKIRSVSDLPIKFIVNTHYHPDHQRGNAIVGPAATVISTDWTRRRTLAVMQSQGTASSLRPAEVTFEQQLTIHLDPYSAQVYFPGKAHTSGDALVYFPQQGAIAMGDLFLTNSCPAMDQGSAEQWIQALGHVLDLPVESVVPGHFELASKTELRRFRDYLSDLYSQVQVLYGKGATEGEVRRSIHMDKYRDFRQYDKYQATFADNAVVIYQQLQQH